MLSKYPILDNRPIDLWKVTELKEELKRRKLTTRGLKDDLIKRLDEALRIERENNVQDVITGDDLDNQPVDVAEDSEATPIVTEEAEAVTNSNAEKVEDVGDVNIQIDINDSVEATGEEPRGSVVVSGDGSSRAEGELFVPAATLEISTEVSENVASELTLVGQEPKTSETEEVNGDSKSQLGNEPEVDNNDSKSQLDNEGSKPQHDTDDSKSQLGNEGSKPQLDNDDSKSQLDNEVSKPQHDSDDSKSQLDNDDSKSQLDNDDSKSQLDNEDSKLQVENESLRSPREDEMHDSSTSNIQVSEVSPNLGFQVKSDSISTDSVSINEKTELKDNIITDNVKLELDVKPKMVEASSNNIVPVDGESHPMDVEESQENKASVEEKDDRHATNADISKKNDIVDVGYSEKLNLDRSSGDDSMEEDVSESKQIDSKYISDDVRDKSEKSEMHAVKEENLVDVVGNTLSIDDKEMSVENKTSPAVPAEKRKLNEQDVGSNEPLKRQRRWNSERGKVPEAQISNVVPTTTPKNVLQPTLPRRSFSRSDSSVSNEDTPKERVVPPSQRHPTNSLRIDNFLRPFTLKAVQELLGKTGSVTSFWMDQIKTHCYISYSSMEEAIETRNAVYNLQWPPNGGKLLVAEFVDPQEVKSKLEVPRSPAAPLTPGAFAAPSLQPPPQPSPRLQVSRQQQLPPPPPLPLPPPPPLSNPPPAKERLGHPPLPPPPPVEKHNPPIVTLDDLFRKTTSIPRIYYLPLSEEQVAAKLTVAQRGKNAKQ